jgi:hypothetical protein
VLLDHLGAAPVPRCPLPDLRAGPCTRLNSLAAEFRRQTSSEKAEYVLSIRRLAIYFDAVGGASDPSL